MEDPPPLRHSRQDRRQRWARALHLPDRIYDSLAYLPTTGKVENKRHRVHWDVESNDAHVGFWKLFVRDKKTLP